MLEGSIEEENMPHLFVEKQVIAVTIRNAYLDGTKEAIPYTYCEVYAPREIMSNVSIICCSLLKLLTFSSPPLDSMV